MISTSNVAATPKQKQGTYCCLHLGMPKTATTTMQRHLFRMHSQVEYLGKFSKNRYRDGQLTALMRLVLQKDLLPNRQLDAFHKRYAKAVESAMRSGRVPVLSKEGLTAGGARLHRVHAQHFRQVFGDCKIVIVLRHPMKLMESQYLQKLKGSHTGGSSRIGRRPRIFSLEDWLRKNWKLQHKGAMGHLDYAETVQIYEETFGRENVGVFLFEHLIEDMQRFIHCVCEFMGIDGDEGYRLIENNNAQQRWTMKQLELLRTIERSKWKSTVFRFASRRKRLAMLDFNPNKTDPTSPKMRADLPDEWQKRISQYTREGNRWLIEQRNLPLEQFGYPL